MNWSKRRERFRAILAGGRCVHPGSVFHPISARIAESLGFEIGMFAGSVASLTVLGAPDLIVLTLTEFAEQAYRICRAGDLALLVDADHGYGNALNVQRTVQELETAGVAGLTIEDTVLPRPFGEDKATLVSIAEGVGKMRAALSGRQDGGCDRRRTSAVSVSGSTTRSPRQARGGRRRRDVLYGVQTREQPTPVRRAKVPLILAVSAMR